MRRGLVALAMATSLAGCVTHTEQQHKILVSNDSAAPVIVQFGQNGGSRRVEPRTRGMGVNSLGLLHGPIVVMDTTCREIASIDLTPQQYGTLRIRQDGSAVLEEGDPGEAAFLKGTEECHVEPS